MDTLRPWARQSPGRLPDPSAGGAESQRTKTATQAEDIGCEGHQQVTGRQRHLLVETLGLIVAVVVPAATPDDRRGLVALLQRYGASGTKRLRQLGGDAAEPAQWLCAWGRRLPQPPEIARDVVEHPGKECQVVQHGWKEERTVAW
jgi:hypothetical protein